MKRIVISLLVENTAGVLSRIAGLFSRRGYNIDSLTVGVTDNPSLSRMTVVARGDDEILEQIKKQLSKLIDVISIKELKEGSSVTRELMLVKVNAGPEERQQVMSIADIFRAKIVDVSDTSITMELTGDQNKLEAFVRLISKYGIDELARTGITGLRRGMGAEETDTTSII